jgi:hypothetical protein
MDELRVLLMPPRGSVSLLGGATSSSMIRGDPETECLLEELDVGAFDDRVFLGKKLVAIFCCCTNSQRVHQGLLAGGKNTQEKYIEGGVYYYYDYYFL